MLTELKTNLEEQTITRTEEYLTAHPDLKELFDVIQTVKNADHVPVTVTTGISHTPVGDEVTLLIQGWKTYGFGLSHTKIISIDSTTGTSHGIKLSHRGDISEIEYLMKKCS